MEKLILNIIHEEINKFLKEEKLLQEWLKYLTESSLSRLYQHMLDYETAILTGFRSDPNDISNCVEGSVNSETINQVRNRNIKAFLLDKNYGVTEVDGTYIEDFNTPVAKEVSENSLFVTNMGKDKNFITNIINMGKKFCQDSVLIIPKGGKEAYLYGTNKSEFPGLDQKISVGDSKFGKGAEFMTKVRNRPMTFVESKKLQTFKSLSRSEKMAVRAIAQEQKEENK